MTIGSSIPQGTGTDRVRVIDLDGPRNFRDLGGYAAHDGRSVRWGHVFRSDGLDRVTPADVERLRGMGLRTVIDLRTQGEIDLRGRFPVDAHPVEYHHLPVLDVLWPDDEVDEHQDAADFLHAAYSAMLTTGAPRLAGALEALAAPGAFPAVFHCAAGKDRTGLVAAFLLGSLGVTADDVVADYALTAVAMERLLAWAQAQGGKVARDWARIPTVHLASPPLAMQRVLSDIVTIHGSVPDYLLSIGVASATLAHLRDTLLEDAPTPEGTPR